MLHVILVVFFAFFFICGIETYSLGVNPKEKYARVNDTFEISCFVHQSGGKLDFYDGDNLVPESYIKRINDSYIIYANACTKPTKKNITCKREENIVGMSEIYIDEGIAPVKDFKCRTNDLKKLSCTFKKPSSNHPIAYRMVYANNNIKKQNCKLIPDFKGGYSCNITVDEDPLKAFFNFTLRGHTEFYKRKENFDIHLLETFLPKKIEHLHVELKPKDSMSGKDFIIFTLPNFIEPIAKEMMFEVETRPKDENEWEKIIHRNFEEDIHNKRKMLALTNIKFSNTIYQLRIRMKTKSSLDTDEMWSPYIEETFITHPKLPEMIPNVCNNCFNVMDNDNIYLYWTEVPKFYQNGDDFKYFVKIFNAKTHELIGDINSTKTFLMISNKISQPHMLVHIYSLNQEGLSKNYASINVYKDQNKNFVNIKKEWLDKNVGYKLSWRPNDHIIDIKNYTVIWCRQTSELPNKCDSPIEYKHLPANQTEFYLNTTHSYQFGIAINTFDDKIRGIQWAKCTSSKPDEIGTVNDIWYFYLKEDSMYIEWYLNCVDKDIVAAYNIQYYVVSDIDKKVPLGNQFHEIFNATNNRRIRNFYQISNLKPYKIYNISIAMISTSGRSGAFSKPISVRTLEGSPSAPQNLEVIDVYSNSIELQWNKPIEINGPSLTYQLWYNERWIHIDNNETMNETFRYHLNNLESSTNYTITVVACTRNCSQSSGSILQRTKVGKPGRISEFHRKSFKNGSFELQWQRPSHFGGYFEYYLLSVSNHYGNEEVHYKIHSSRNSCVIQELNCDKSGIFFSIRGVNVDYTNLSSFDTAIIDHDDCFANEGEFMANIIQFDGDLSETLPYSCGSNLLDFMNNSPIILTFCVFFLIILLSVTGIKLIKAYYKLQDMKDIKILFPDGLDPNSVKKENSISSLTDFDLLKTCTNLEKIREESYKELELYENPPYSKENFSLQIKEQTSNDDNKELLTPLFPKSQTLDVVQCRPQDKIKSFSVPNSPAKHDQNVDPGYVKMHQPKKSVSSVSNSPVGGYLDMSRKSSNPYINQSNMLNSKDIKAFIQDSQMNNGYIQRNSVRNSFPVKNSSGYVGFETFKN